MKDLRKKTVSGFAYKFAERVGAQGLSFVLQLVLARILLPGDYGVVGLVTVFIAICDVFVTHGFGTALIANKDSDSKDFSTCFYFNLMLAAVLYLVVFFGSPLVAKIYSHFDEKLLVSVMRVMGLRIPIAAFNSVQHAYVSKHMRFKKFFYATLIGTIISGAIAVVMALNGCGVWSLVEQYLGNAFIDTICLFIIVGWRPTREFSFERLKKIYSFGWKILVVGLIDTLYSRLRNLVIGAKYTKEDLAYYNRGYSFPSFGMRLIEPTVNTVLFPALSGCQDDQAEMRHITRNVLQVSTYIVTPIMVGLAVVAKPLVHLLLTDKWLPCVIYLQIGCLANLFRCQQFINNQVIKASKNSALLLKLDILKKCIGLVLLIVSMQFGVLWIALSLVVTNLISLFINIAPNRKILNYGYLDQFKDVLLNMVPGFLMGACIYPIQLLKLHTSVILVLQVVLGVALYIGFSLLLRNHSFHLLLNYLKKNVFSRKKKAKGKENEDVSASDAADVRAAEMDDAYNNDQPEE
uniref:Polysaccharide biosynthesis protein n=1 Tax=uncultured bacterium Contig248 TaxID=1393544 RepID=W0FNF8_9BACT|nr:polysaccharide biosynthesis protein [uncultured bacterium Contig248]